MITIFTDGSSRGNPGPGGWGSVVVFDADLPNVSRVLELGGYEKETTNNRMEILAAVHALQVVPQSSKVTLYTDSAYLINGITKWVKGWQKKGWMTLQKEPVANRDLWERLISATENKEISWTKVGGHVGTVGNERCDEIATMSADQKDIHLFEGSFSDYSIKDILKISVDREAMSKKTSDKERSNAKAYSYISLVNGVVQTHETWAQCEARVKGKSGTRFKKALSPSNEKEIIADFQRSK